MFRKDEAKDKANDSNITLNGSQTDICKVVNTILSEVNELRSQLAAITSANVYKDARIKKLESSNEELTTRLSKLEVEKFNYTQLNINNKNKRKNNAFAIEDDIEQPAPKAMFDFSTFTKNPPVSFCPTSFPRIIASRDSASKTPVAKTAANSSLNGHGPDKNGKKLPQDPAPGNRSGKSNKRRSTNLLIGSRVGSDLFAAPRKFHYCVSKVRPDFDTSRLKDYIGDFLTGSKQDIEVEEIPLRHNTYYRMFKVSVLNTFDSDMKNVLNWPCGIEIKRFFFPKGSSNNPVASTSKNIQSVASDSASANLSVYASNGEMEHD